MDQLKDELVKDMTDRIEETIKSKLEVEEIEPKVFTDEELREREVCLNPSGFTARWLECSQILDKWYPERELKVK